MVRGPTLIWVWGKVRVSLMASTGTGLVVIVWVIRSSDLRWSGDKLRVEGYPVQAAAPGKLGWRLGDVMVTAARSCRLVLAG